MSGLFDAIKGAIVLAGGSRMDQLEEDKVRSEIQYRKDKLSTDKELAQSQRELTERLAVGQREHEKGMQGSDQAFKATESSKDREFKASESKFVRDHATELAILHREAQEGMLRYQKASDADMIIMKLENDRKIAELEAGLRRQGLEIEREKLNKMAPWQIDVMMKAYEIASKSALGEQGLFNAYIMKTPGAFEKNLAAVQTLMQSIFNTVEAGKIDLPNISFLKSQSGSTPGAGPIHVPRPFNISPPKGSSPDQWTLELDILESKQRQGLPIDADLARLKSQGWTDDSVPPLGPAPPAPGSKPYMGGTEAPSTLLPGDKGVTYFPMGNIIDNTGPNPIPRQDVSLSPRDQLALKLAAGHALSATDPAMAAAEYESMITDPNSMWGGTTDLNPADRINYGKKALGFFRSEMDFLRGGGQ
jgi:hypothetical protein